MYPLLGPRYPKRHSVHVKRWLTSCCSSYVADWAAGHIVGIGHLQPLLKRERERVFVTSRLRRGIRLQIVDGSVGISSQRVLSKKRQTAAH